MMKIAARFIGIVIFICILTGIDLRRMMTTVFSIPPFYALLLVLSVLPIMLLRGARWKVVAEGLDLNLDTKEATEALCLAQLANLVIPGSFGDLIRIPYMKTRGNPADRTIISILLDAIIGSVFPFTLGVLALAVILEITLTVEALLICGLWVAGGYAFYRIIKATLWSRFMQARLKRLMEEGIRGRSFFTLSSMMRSIGGKRIALSLFLALLWFIVYVTQAYVLAQILGVEVHWVYLAFTMGVTMILIAIPVTIQGLGLREGALLFMLTRIAIDPVLVVSFSLTLMVFNMTPAIAGLILWFRNPFVDITDQDVLDNDAVLPSENLFET
ncbi:MAG: UPF0104 family protein [Candidatus Thorarchaeota archaeon]|nr:UPF0104 family protein [Candidatus Thorarchaeota archaeon]